MPEAVALLLLFAAFALLIHHGFKHSQEPPDTLARLESCAEVCYFQTSDISNHETWIIVCVTNAITILILTSLIQCKAQN